jgi:hypothetical protein
MQKFLMQILVVQLCLYIMSKVQSITCRQVDL